MRRCALVVFLTYGDLAFVFRNVTAILLSSVLTWMCFEGFGYFMRVRAGGHLIPILLFFLLLGLQFFMAHILL